MKFKIGDVIKHSQFKYLVKDIIVGERIVKGKWSDWRSSKCVTDSYILEDVDSKHLYYLTFSTDTSEYELIQSQSCPRCNGELKDHMSYALGTMIKKCPNCGWC